MSGFTQISRGCSASVIEPAAVSKALVGFQNNPVQAFCCVQVWALKF